MTYEAAHAAGGHATRTGGHAASAGRARLRARRATSRAHSARSESTTSAHSRPAGADARAAGDHRPRPDRDGRRQRRRRCRDLLAGRPEVRDEPAVGAAAAGSRADRQPGDGRAARGGDRRRSREADQGALRALLGLLLGLRPLRPELPDDRHGVHRGQPRARLLRDLGVHRGADRRRRARRDHRERELPHLGARDVRVRLREPARDPAVPALASEARADPPRLRRPRDPGRRDLDGRPADHRSRRHDGRPLAAVLPAVERDRQADHPAVDQLRAPRHVDRRGRRRPRGDGPDGDLRVRFRRHPLCGTFRQRRPDRRGSRACARVRPQVPCTRSSC